MLFHHPETSTEKEPEFNRIAGYFVCGHFWHCECTRAIKAIEGLSQSLILPEDTMSSELVFGSMTYVSNRFLLTRVVAKATRRFHRPNTRTQDTASEVFERFTRANPLAAEPYTGNLQSFPRAAQGETVHFLKI
jgi:hypothetical protein